MKDSASEATNAHRPLIDPVNLGSSAPRDPSRLAAIQTAKKKGLLWRVLFKKFSPLLQKYFRSTCNRATSPFHLGHQSIYPITSIQYWEYSSSQCKCNARDGLVRSSHDHCCRKTETARTYEFLEKFQTAFDPGFSPIFVKKIYFRFRGLFFHFGREWFSCILNLYLALSSK